MRVFVVVDLRMRAFEPEKFRDRLTVVSNLAHPLAGGIGSDAGADHARSATVFLSGTKPEKDRIQVDMTMDQVAARHIGQDTPLPSLELSIEEVALSCGNGYGCACSNTIAWRTPTLLLPMENNPHVVFERLFDDGSNAADRLARKQESRSLLDSVMDQVASLKTGLPASDRTRLTEYLDDIREIERQIQKAEEHTPKDLTLPEAPVGIPEAFDDHFKIMFDLKVLAFRAEITRVVTMMYAHDTSGAVYPQSGVRDGFHVASHHSNVRANMDKFALINKYHVEKLAYFLDKLKSTPKWRRHFARSFDRALRQQHEQRQSARSRSAAGSGGGRGVRPAGGEPALEIRASHADVEPAVERAGQARRAPERVQ
jgi:Protein of unknown function (DUF1552)